MKVSVIIAHPHPGSFNHEIAEMVIRALEENWHTVCFHDLYQERFDPVLPYDEIFRNALLPPVIAQHCTKDCYSRRNCFWASRLVGDASRDTERLDRPGTPARCYLPVP
jgi:putative NADPH-quinone reductase